MVRAKFKVNGKKEMLWNGNEGNLAYEVTLNPVYNSDPESENGKFYAATPSGSILLAVINPSAAAGFEVGKEYYVSFEQA